LDCAYVSGSKWPLEIVQLLLANNADSSLVNNDGETALIIAKRKDHSEVAKEIEKAITVKKLRKLNEELHTEF
jgi:ankyrin repeat protein